MPEQQNLEWKLKWKDDYLAEICGFANAQGGRLLIGVDDFGRPVGVSQAEDLLVDLPCKIRQKLGIVAQVNLLKESGLDIIEICVSAYSIPIAYKCAYYQRSGSTNQQLDGINLDRFLRERNGVTWDAAPCPDFEMKNVDGEVVKRFKIWASQSGRLLSSLYNESKKTLLKRLHLFKNDYLVNAAPLLFADDPEEWIPGAYTKIGFFKTDGNLVYQDQVHGSILIQVDKILETIRLKYMKAKISYEGSRRIERYFVPDAALREALLNALCHKDYSSGIPVQISVYDDRLYIGNNGVLPSGWSIDSLSRKHESLPYNPLVANVFQLAGFIESWGLGVEKIFEACREAKVPKPTYVINPRDIMLKFTAPYDWFHSLKNQGGNNWTTDEPERVTNEPEGVTNKPEGVTNKPEGVTNKSQGVTNELERESKPTTNTSISLLTEKETTLLALLQVNPNINYESLAQELSVSRKTIAERLRRLREKGVIERVGSNRYGSWRIIDA